jgi:hypothetical protein
MLQMGQPDPPQLGVKRKQREERSESLPSTKKRRKSQQEDLPDIDQLLKWNNQGLLDTNSPT